MNYAELDLEKLIPITRNAFRLYEIAEMFFVSVRHLFTLIAEGELLVPKENITAAKSRACILVPRENLVDFVRRRSSARKRDQRKGGGR